jgi:plasmanylethanolamine desaturase
MSLTVALLLASLRIVLRVAICFFIADLLVGIVHWLEDSYGSPTWPIIGSLVIAPNLLHHAQPRAFLSNSWWASANFQVILAAVVGGAAALLGWLSPELLLVLVLAANANEFHRWAHRTRTENGRMISFLQDAKLLQSRAHHGRHHGGKRNSHYCSITSWVDPVLERIGWWRGLERMIALVTGVVPRIDPAVAARLAKA